MTNGEPWPQPTDLKARYRNATIHVDLSTAIRVHRSRCHGGPSPVCLLSPARAVAERDPFSSSSKLSLADGLWKVDLVEAAESGGLVASRHPLILERQQKERRVQVLVRDNNVDQALKALKKKMQREGIFREMKLRGHYEKPSEKKAREKAEAVRRARKLARKRAQREGLI